MKDQTGLGGPNSLKLLLLLLSLFVSNSNSAWSGFLVAWVGLQVGSRVGLRVAGCELPLRVWHFLILILSDISYYQSIFNYYYH